MFCFLWSLLSHLTQIRASHQTVYTTRLGQNLVESATLVLVLARIILALVVLLPLSNTVHRLRAVIDDALLGSIVMRAKWAIEGSLGCDGVSPALPVSGALAVVPHEVAALAVFFLT